MPFYNFWMIRLFGYPASSWFLLRFPREKPPRATARSGFSLGRRRRNQLLTGYSLGAPAKWITVTVERKAVMRQFPVAKCVCFVIFHDTIPWCSYWVQKFDLFRKKTTTSNVIMFPVFPLYVYVSVFKGPLRFKFSVRVQFCLVSIRQGQFCAALRWNIKGFEVCKI